MLATQQDILKLDKDINKMREGQADVITKMSELSGNLQALNSQLESSQQRMTVLSQKLDDLQADIDQRMKILSGQVTGTSAPASSSPADQYRLAYNDYQAGKYDLAIVGFRNFVTQYPKSEMAPQVQFYIGEADYARKNYADAAREYERVFQMFPKSEFAPKALFKKGVALQQIGNGDEAEKTMRRLIKEYPRHELAKSARDVLKASQ
jgi:tol-pal system protein YbgF